MRVALRRTPLLILFMALGTGLLFPAEAQILKRLKDRAKEKIEEKIIEKQDEAIDRAFEGGGEEEEEPEAEPEAETDEEAAPEAPAQKPTTAQENAASQEPARLKPGQGAWSNFDFVPGERVLFAEDFSRDRVGNFPQRFELLTGNAEVVEWNGSRWIRMNDYTGFKINLGEVLPQRFTIEFDLTVPWSRMGLYSEPFQNTEQFVPSRYQTSSISLSGTEAGAFLGGEDGDAPSSKVDPRDIFANMYPDDGPRLSTEPIRVRVQVDGKYIKVYMNEKRVSNFPNGNFGRQNYIVFEFDDNGEEADSPLMGNLSINAGGSPMYDALMSDGRFATQGILFDTGSDRIRPESTPTLKEIAAMLKEHGDLRILIEGHTDNVGKAENNQVLSDKRAMAVKTYLVESGIDASRLEAKGFGQTRPNVPNDTAEGRQQNRRVELVKL